jgi:tetratricopeptide (TPR) repeat protein
MQSIGRTPASVETQKPGRPDIDFLPELLSDLRRGELVRALERIETQREFVDSSETASYLAGLARATHGDPVGAIRHLEQAIRLNPRHARALEARAIALQSLGREEEGIADSEALVRIEPQDPRAWILLATTNFRANKFHAALGAYARALFLDPDNTAAITGEALSLHALQRDAEAIGSYDRALLLAPRDKALWHNRAVSLASLNQNEQALDSYGRAIALDPNYLPARDGAIVALLRLKKFNEALTLCDETLPLAPDHAPAKFMKANALHELRRFTEALLLYDLALLQCPNDPRIIANRGITLLQLGAFEDALAAALEAVRWAPDFVVGWRCKGSAELRLTRYEDALASFDIGLQLSSNDPDILCGRAIALKELSRFDEALDGFEQALSADPAHVEAKANLGALLLLLGRFPEGLPLFEYRWIQGEVAKANSVFPWPEWKGEPLEGKRLLVMDEAGLGDVIQYCRYLPLLAESAANVDFSCRRPMRALLSGVNHMVNIIDHPDGDEEYNFCVALCSLPLAFGTALDTIPAKFPYLRADEDRSSIWSARIGKHGFKVGVSWHGSSHAHSDNARATPLAALAPLAEIAGVRLISLQKNMGVEELLASPNGMRIEMLDADFDASGDAFLDAAAVIENLDLVISVDTSIAHLAGALGKPVWIALKHVPEWRWLLGRNDSPWYPTARLFRQEQRGDWDGLFRLMAKALKELVSATAASARAPILLPGSVGELIDRLTILEIKSQRITDQPKRANVQRELVLLREMKSAHISQGPDLDALERSLKEVNLSLWNIEDMIRRHELQNDFGDEFINLARRVYKENDRRAALKRQINLLFDSPLIEEKSYDETSEK